MIDWIATYGESIITVLLHSMWQVALVFVLYRLIPSDRNRSSIGLYWPILAILALIATTALVIPTTVTKDLSVTQLTTSVENSWASIILGFYFFGVLVQIARLTRDYVSISQWKSKGIIVRRGAIYNCVKTLSQKLKIKVPQIRLVHDLSVPMVVGMIKPVILFPVSLMTHLTAEELENIILHELSHVRRNDYLWNLVMTFMEAVLFFNPFVYWLMNDIRSRREIVCDLTAAEISKNPKALATALLTIEELISNPKLGMALNSQGQLSERIHVLLKLKKKKRGQLNMRVMASLLVCVPFLFGFHQEEKVRSYSSTLFEIRYDSITVPGFHEAIHSLEFQSADGEIKDVKINDESIALKNPEQIYSLKDQMSDPLITTNKKEMYESGLTRKYEIRKQLRKSARQGEKQTEIEEEQNSGEGESVIYNLATIDGYQYGKALDTSQSWVEGPSTDNILSLRNLPEDHAKKTYFLKIPVDAKGEEVGDVVVKYDRGTLSRASSFGYSDEYIEEELEQMLIDHGLIRSDYSYSLELSHEALRVNGEEQSIRLHRLFKARYVDMTRKNPSSKFNYQILKNQIQ